MKKHRISSMQFNNDKVKNAAKNFGVGLELVDHLCGLMDYNIEAVYEPIIGAEPQSLSM